MGIVSVFVMAMMTCAIIPASISMQATPPTSDGQNLEWISHEVYSPMAWGKTSLAVDNQGKEHIAFWDTATYNLIYATNARGSWTWSVVDSSWNTTGEAMVALDSSGSPHLVYTIPGNPATYNSTLRYANRVNGNWNITDIVEGEISWGNDMTMDLNDKVHIAYTEYIRSSDRFDVVYCTDSNGAWAETVVGQADGPTVSIAADHQGKAYISYSSPPNGVLMLATNSNGSWANKIIDDQSLTLGFYSSIAVDPLGTVHISYVDYNSQGKLKYATNPTGNWTCEYIDTESYINSPTSLAVDSEQRAHITYFDWFHSEVKYATNKNGSWEISVPVQASESGHGPSLALDANDMPHISYVSTSHSQAACTVLTLPHPVPTYHVSEPSASVSWRIGETHRIQWESADTGPLIKLDLCLPGTQPEGWAGPVSVLVINGAFDNIGYYDWTVPDIMPSNAYQIMVSDAADNSTFAYSGEFNIKAPKLPDVTGVVCTQLDYPISGAQILIDDLGSITSEQNGYFIVELSKGEHSLTFSAEGFDSLTTQITVGNVTTLDLGKIQLTVNNSAMHLVTYHHGTDFSMLIPESWELAQDVSIGGGRFALVLNGSTNWAVRTNINVQTALDPSAQGTSSYLWNLANNTIQGLQQGGYSASIFGSPKFLTISDHPAMIYSIKYEGSGLMQEQALVIDAGSHRGWVITFTTSQSEYPTYRPTFDQIALSLQVSDASSNGYIDPVSLAVLIGMVAGLGVLVISFRIRERAGSKR